MRMLLVHQAEGFRERGASVSLNYDLTPSTPFGSLARVTPSWGGQATSRAEEQGVLRVVPFRKTPLNAEIGAESNDEHSFPTLWDTEVRRVKQTEHNVVLGARPSGV